MTIEMTSARLEDLRRYIGTIGIEGEEGHEEIVVRIAFHGCANVAKYVYDDLLNIEE